MKTIFICRMKAKINDVRNGVYDYNSKGLIDVCDSIEFKNKQIIIGRFRYLNSIY